MSQHEQPLLIDLVHNPCRVTTTEPRGYDFSAGWIDAHNRAERIEAAFRQIIREELVLARAIETRKDAA